MSAFALLGVKLTLGRIAQLFGYMQPRTIRVAAMFYFDGLQQNEIAEQESIDIRTVRRDLAQFAEAVERSSVAMPKRPAAPSRHVRQLDSRMMRSL